MAMDHETDFIYLSQLSRKEKREIWIQRNQLTLETIGVKVGLSDASVARLLGSESIPTKHHQAFLGIGMPPEILPPAVDRKRGRIPRRLKRQAEQAGQISSP